MTDMIKTTALTTIGNGLSHTTLVAVVDMSGTPVSNKANLQVIGNLFMDGAGGSYFSPAALSNVALSVANAAQPNITSVGTLTSVTVSGNVTAGNANLGNLASANYFSGNGSGLSSIAVANVSGLGNIATSNIDGNASNIFLGNGAFSNPVTANVPQFVEAPSTNTSEGTTGQIAFDGGGNVFVCVATNSWSKVSGTTSW